jgi:TRAP-type C4-dicarboxylate transport system permease small subunit
MKRLEALAATIFGLAFLVLAVAVTVENIMRKVFNQSLQGVDELGGYLLALGGAMSFSVALVARAHIRIDIVHDHLPAPLRVALNVLASLSILACAVALLRMAWFAYDESATLGATAQTPWRQPEERGIPLWWFADGPHEQRGSCKSQECSDNEADRVFHVPKHGFMLGHGQPSAGWSSGSNREGVPPACQNTTVFPLSSPVRASATSPARALAV